MAFGSPTILKLLKHCDINLNVNYFLNNAHSYIKKRYTLIICRWFNKRQLCARPHRSHCKVLNDVVRCWRESEETYEIMLKLLLYHLLPTNIFGISNRPWPYVQCTLHNNMFTLCLSCATLENPALVDFCSTLFQFDFCNSLG